MTLHYQNDRATIYHGDCRDIMEGQLPDNWVDSIVTDPPYELGFMGKGWDGSGIAYSSEVWENAYRILKPGGHLLAFGGTRTWHRLAVAIEDAGFEIRDNVAYLHDGGLPGPLAWCYGSGFPKSLDVSKAIDKAAGAERVPSGAYTATQCDFIQRGEACPGHGDESSLSSTVIHRLPTAPATPAAQQWQGWGTALKPAFEPIVVARKPLIGTVAENVLAHGTGALNIDGCRIGTTDNLNGGTFGGIFGNGAATIDKPIGTGRWPANVILDESQAAELDRQSGQAGGGFGVRGTGGQTYANGKGFANTLAETGQSVGYGDSGGASRFFYCPKAGKKERPNVDGVAHPTVKPLKLMEYLCRLVTPPGGTILEPFSGSGTTIEAALNEGFNVIGIEMTDEYLPLIMARIERHGDKLC
jgi:hypothetical protein